MGLTRGRPRGRRVDCNPSVAAVRRCHAASPYGRPRRIDSAIAASSAALCGRFTHSVHRAGRCTGQSAQLMSDGIPSAGPGFVCCHSEPQRHRSARSASFARSALRSTYRHTASRCSSRSMGKLLNRPWYSGPVPAEW